jgi:predicted nucleic acid-binding protein
MVNKILLDANVLYSQPLRMILLNLVQIDECSIQMFWTDKIDTEWSDALNRKYPESKDILTKQVKSIKKSFFDCYVLGYESLMDQFELPDPDDHHVLAAAIKADCNIIATDNIKDFPPKLLAAYNIRTMTRDELMCFLFVNEKISVVRALENFARIHKGPKLTVKDLLIKLERSVPNFTRLVSAL